MENARWERLVEIMTAMGEGDRAAPFMLYNEFGQQVAAAVRRQLARLGTADIAADDLDGLTIDACLELADCAKAWRSEGGALPWNWAAQRIGNLVSNFLGTYADPYDSEVHDVEADGQVQTPGRDADDLDVLASLSISHLECGLLAQALTQVATPRDQALLLGVKLQRSLGDPSPAVTLGAIWGLKPDAVRQAVRRVTGRLRHLAETEVRYAPLADLPLLN